MVIFAVNILNMLDRDNNKKPPCPAELDPLVSFSFFTCQCSLPFPFTDPTFPTNMHALPTSSIAKPRMQSTTQKQGISFTIFIVLNNTLLCLLRCKTNNRFDTIDRCVCYFFLARPPCLDFSIASLTCRSSWSLMDWLTISSSE